MKFSELRDKYVFVDNQKIAKVKDVGIDTDSSTQVFLVTATLGSGASEPISVGQLDDNQEADVYVDGSLTLNSKGCYSAHTIIAYELTP